MFYEDDETVRAAILKDLIEVSNPKYLTAFNRILVANGGRYFVGKSLSWADVIIADTLKSITTHHNTDMKNYPALQQHMENFHEIPQIKDWIQERPATDV